MGIISITWTTISTSKDNEQRRCSGWGYRQPTVAFLTMKDVRLYLQHEWYNVIYRGGSWDIERSVKVQMISRKNHLLIMKKYNKMLTR